MSQKSDKARRREGRRVEKRIEETLKFKADEMVREMRTYPTKLRWQYAVFLTTGWWKPKEASDGRCGTTGENDRSRDGDAESADGGKDE